jgi:hypothetical protein
MKYRFKLGFVFVVIGLLGAPRLAHCSEVISFTINPTVCLAPCTVVARVRIEDHPANQSVQMLLECSSGFERRSEMASPPGAPRTVQIKFPGIPAGTCVLVMRLVRHDAGTYEAGRAEKRLEVKGVD